MSNTSYLKSRYERAPSPPKTSRYNSRYSSSVSSSYHPTSPLLSSKPGYTATDLYPSPSLLRSSSRFSSSVSSSPFRPHHSVVDKMQRADAAPGSPPLAPSSIPSPAPSWRSRRVVVEKPPAEEKPFFKSSPKISLSAPGWRSRLTQEEKAIISTPSLPSSSSSSRKEARETDLRDHSALTKSPVPLKSCPPRQEETVTDSASPPGDVSSIAPPPPWKSRPESKETESAIPPRPKDTLPNACSPSQSYRQQEKSVDPFSDTKSAAPTQSWQSRQEAKKMESTNACNESPSSLSSSWLSTPGGAKKINPKNPSSDTATPASPSMSWRSRFVEEAGAGSLSSGAASCRSATSGRTKITGEETTKPETVLRPPKSDPDTKSSRFSKQSPEKTSSSTPTSSTMPKDDNIDSGSSPKAPLQRKRSIKLSRDRPRSAKYKKELVKPEVETKSFKKDSDIDVNKRTSEEEVMESAEIQVMNRTNRNRFISNPLRRSLKTRKSIKRQGSIKKAVPQNPDELASREEKPETDPLGFIEIRSAAQWRAVSQQISWRGDDIEDAAAPGPPQVQGFVDSNRYRYRYRYS